MGLLKVEKFEEILTAFTVEELEYMKTLIDLQIKKLGERDENGYD